MAKTYDAILLVAFGGPEKPDDVMPFMENVLRGRSVPRERMMEVAEHYGLFGGRSPINDQCRELIDAMKAAVPGHGIDLPIYWGNRNWHPMLADTLRTMRDDGVKRALALFTTAYSSYSSCRQYLEDLQGAAADVGDGAPAVDKLRGYFNHPGFIESWVARVAEALAQLPAEHQADAKLLFAAHSIPTAMVASCRYEAQLREAVRLIAAAWPDRASDLVYQSRSGPPTQPWLEPDVCDYLKEETASAVVIVPIGFISDHMEVVYDLDTEASEVCEQRGIAMARAATPGTHPRFVSMICELIRERLSGGVDRPVVGDLPAELDECAADCCPALRRPA